MVKAFPGVPILRADGETSAPPSPRQPDLVQGSQPLSVPHPLAGELDREALASIVFAEPASRRRLNAATHLPVLLAVLRQAAAHWLAFRPVAVIDMPLLFETGFYRVTSPSVLVACSPAVQLRRLQARDGMAREAAAARVAAQMPTERKRDMADAVLENDGSVEELRAQVAQLARRLRRGAWLHRTLLSPAGAALAAAALARLVLR